MINIPFNMNVVFDLKPALRSGLFDIRHYMQALKMTSIRWVNEIANELEDHIKKEHFSGSRRTYGSKGKKNVLGLISGRARDSIHAVYAGEPRQISDSFLLVQASVGVEDKNVPYLSRWVTEGELGKRTITSQGKNFTIPLPGTNPRMSKVGMFAMKGLLWRNEDGDLHPYFIVRPTVESNPIVSISAIARSQKVRAIMTAGRERALNRLKQKIATRYL